MAILTKREIIEALERLGQLAEAQGEKVELVLVGGALAKTIAVERDWPEDWLNDAVKGYLVGLSLGPVIFSAPGIEVRRPSIAQLLAMKLSAWRDDVDIADARRLLTELRSGRDREEVWQDVRPYLIPGDELKAHYAFQDLWESLYGDA